MDTFVCVNARFKFFNGKDVLTVEYAYGVQKWYIFNNEESTNAIFNKSIVPKLSRTPNRYEAEAILDEYLNTKQS